MPVLGLALGRMRELSPTDGAGIVDALQTMPDLVAEILQKGEQIRELAVKYANESTLFLGRQSLTKLLLKVLRV